MKATERLLIKANHRLNRLIIQRHELVENSPEWMGLSSLMRKEKATVADLKGRLIRQQPKRVSFCGQKAVSRMTA